jgi:hypothetical protein
VLFLLQILLKERIMGAAAEVFRVVGFIGLNNLNETFKEIDG